MSARRRTTASVTAWDAIWRRQQRSSYFQEIGRSDPGEEGLNLLTQGNTIKDSTDVEQQQGIAYQLDLFEGEEVRPRGERDDGIVSQPHRELQASAASRRSRPLAYALMERVCDPTNLNKAYKRVKANQGAPGIDGMRTSELRAWIIEHKEELVRSLREGMYEPDPVRGKEIPKPGTDSITRIT